MKRLVTQEREAGLDQDVYREDMPNPSVLLKEINTHMLSVAGTACEIRNNHLPQGSGVQYVKTSIVLHIKTLFRNADIGVFITSKTSISN